MNSCAATLTCPGGLETLLADEARALGFQVDKAARGAVTGTAPLPVLYRLCLWSRFANAVLLRIANLPDADADTLYNELLVVNWPRWIKPGQRFVIAVSGRSEAIANTQHAVFRSKDAIVDSFTSAGLARPQVDRERPELYLQLHLGAEGGIFLNLNGAPLHERGYRTASVDAPVKENLAAAMAAWSLHGLTREQALEKFTAVLDPLCGSGTLLIETAWLLADVAPGLLRVRWGFERWLGHDAAAWTEIRSEAVQRRGAGLAGRLPRFTGFDGDPRAVRAAQANANAAGVGQLLHVERQALAALVRTGRLQGDSGLVITNPPYGERLSRLDAAPFLYRCLSRKLRTQLPGWRVCVLAAQIEHLDEFRIAAYQQQRCYNGPLGCFVRVFELPVAAEPAWPPFRLRADAVVAEEGVPLANRLHKNWKALQGYVQKEGVRAFRLYDADLPEFNVAVDVYGDRIHVQEYAPPATIDPAKATHRLEVALDAIGAVTGKARAQLALKVRAKQKGREQYHRQGSEGALYEVDEYGARLLVNLTDYLDTGLFLDHRPLRHRLQSLCADKYFLNLFCYTGSATVHAALGGARGSVSVDLNPRYLDWAAANLALNGYSEQQHELVQTDVGQWLSRTGDQFDVIFMDAPTFSNSKRTPGVLDIQRDHVQLVDQAMRHLARDGVLLFSNNYRRFKLEESVGVNYAVTDITSATIPPDFARNQKIHQCWEIRHRGR